jgi:hypothetical protein
MKSLKMMQWLGLDPANKQDLKEFAVKIQADETHVPDDWVHIVISKNNKCEWFFVKDFINTQIHGISFERVSLLFGDESDLGDEILFADPEGTGSGVEYPWGVDLRDRLVAKIGGDHYFIIRVDYDHVKSGRIHLISAYSVSKKVVEAAIQEHSINSSVNILERILIGHLKEHSDRRMTG